MSFSLEKPSQRRADIAQLGVEQPAAFDVLLAGPPDFRPREHAQQKTQLPFSQLVFLAGSR